MNIQEKLKEKKCREYSQREAKRQREERVDNEVKRLQREATKAWENLRKDLVLCLELDLEDRGPCQEALAEWYARATTLKCAGRRVVHIVVIVSAVSRTHQEISVERTAHSH